MRTNLGILLLATSLLTGCEDDPLAGLAQNILEQLLSRWDDGANTLTELTPAPTKRGQGAVSVRVGDKIVVAGGFTPGRETNPVVEVYDIATDSWTQAPDWPNPRVLARAVAVGSLVCFGPGSTPGLADVVDFDCLDVDANTWTVVGKPPPGGELHRLVHAIGGQIYAFGNDNPARFDLSAQTWSATASTPTSCSSVIAEGIATTDDEAYLFGCDPGKVVVYDASDDSWTVVDGVPFADEFYVQATALDGVIYASSEDEGIIAAYRPGQMMGEMMPFTTSGAAPARIDRRHFLAAGATALFVATETGDIEDERELLLRYDPATDTWTGPVDFSPLSLDAALITGVHPVGDDLIVVGWEDGGVTFAP